MTTQRLNDSERRLWVLNDFGLYSWWVGERAGSRSKSVNVFVRENRTAIDEHINKQLNKGPAS